MQEILETGTIAKLEDLMTQKDLPVIERFTKLLGVGPVLANEWVLQKGIKTIEELQQRQDELHLTETQKLGIQYENVKN